MSLSARVHGLRGPLANVGGLCLPDLLVDQLTGMILPKPFDSKSSRKVKRFLREVVHSWGQPKTYTVDQDIILDHGNGAAEAAVKVWILKSLTEDMQGDWVQVAYQFRNAYNAHRRPRLHGGTRHGHREFALDEQVRVLLQRSDTAAAVIIDDVTHAKVQLAQAAQLRRGNAVREDVVEFAEGCLV
ncbi:hypothetical protein SARC_10585 [Sphaeroforma arctica JP610]|uniref:Uncharacterized protein n=1 Tax=Sphaeroforma arctica JP610 TaxID=667725 RepID=A0A0L0FJI1_9EUKA|nr:hypothetical protein SARC_10585 [Sphaeroforma arctica JP610]KNC76942.1 hypothetical protein SARC_10585 [Sphaeroforma arctica JP610]|eukprot:XP_014150844.1 hypothetical protein SARC_10585 [Sphaeroforma arctica JP610]